MKADTSMCNDESNENSRPVTPSTEDCCHNACDPCIFDVHNKLLKEYGEKKRQKIKLQNKKNILCLSSYKNFVVVDIKQVSECYILLLVKFQENNIKNNNKILMESGQHIILHLNDFTKPLTPISFTDDTLEFLIKLYHNRKFSTCLKNVNIGDIIRIRGPYGNFKYECNSFQNIVIFTMGSGIAVAYPIAKSIIDNELEETKIHLIGGFQTISQIPLKRELQILADYWNFKCTLYISQMQGNTFSLHGIKLESGRLGKKSVSDVLEHKITNTTLILICGTHEFNHSVEQWIKCLKYTHVYVFQ